MKGVVVLAGLILCSGSIYVEDIPNRLIDYDAFEDQVAVVGKIRKERRITEKEFIRMAARRSTVILDARSTEKFNLLHVKGATHLSLPDFTAEELARIIPSKDTRVLIYCNNNFLNEPTAMASKVSPASLNIHTFNALYSYGYRNVYELGPLIDISKAKIEFEGSLLAYGSWPAARVAEAPR
ncbi:MAG: rhodanese-like domain-containing protein [Candidatus Polarisedimenticolia bacterium]